MDGGRLMGLLLTVFYSIVDDGTCCVNQGVYTEQPSKQKKDKVLLTSSQGIYLLLWIRLAEYFLTRGWLNPVEEGKGGDE